MDNSFNKKPIIILLLSGGFISILNQTTMITAIPPIMEEMGVSANTGQWLTTIFMMVNGIMIPVTAFLMERYTTRQLFTTAMSVFTIGTLFAAIAFDFNTLIIGRTIQLIGSGFMMTLKESVFLLMFPVKRRGMAMGLVGLVISFAPAIGPTISGWIITSYSWRTIFYIMLPIGILEVLIGLKVMKNVTTLTYPKLDILSIILSTFGFGGLLYGFTSAGNNGWGSISTIIFLVIGVITLTLFILILLHLRV